MCLRSPTFNRLTTEIYLLNFSVTFKGNSGFTHKLSEQTQVFRQEMLEVLDGSRHHMKRENLPLKKSEMRGFDW